MLSIFDLPFKLCTALCYFLTGCVYTNPSFWEGLTGKQPYPYKHIVLQWQWDCEVDIANNDTLQRNEWRRRSRLRPPATKKTEEDDKEKVYMASDCPCPMNKIQCA